MGSFDRSPDMVREFRAMRSRLSEMERQQLGRGVQTQMFHANGPSDWVVPRTATLIPGMTHTLDADGHPLMMWFSCGVVASPLAASWKQITFQVWTVPSGSSALLTDSRFINVQGNADTQQVSFSVGVTVAEYIAKGSTQHYVTARVSAENSTSDPLPTIVQARSFDILRIGAGVG